MSIPGAANPLLLGGGDQEYQIERSLRFNSSDSAYLSRTPASAGNRQIFTWSGWIKRSAFGARQNFFQGGNHTAGSNSSYFEFGSSNILRVAEWNGSSETYTLESTQVFRDSGAWLHLLVAFDTTQATASNRIKVYVNGAQITVFATANYPVQNANTSISNNVIHNIGRDPSVGTSYFSGYLADIHFIDGQALTPSSFAETNATTGQWVPKAYTGTYGTNGFHLPFSDNSAATATTLGKDTSGNGNNWTPNNLSIVTGGPTSVAAASGALPIYNTTDTYGTTKGTGTRTDSNNSSIVLAVPMDGANNGTTFTDESATIKGSGSAKTITRNGDTKTSTAQSKYYGSSGYFDGNGDYLQFANSTDFDFGTGNFTIEAWVFTTATSGQLLMGYDPINEFNFDANALYFGRSGSFSSTLGATISTNTWQHVALVRNGSTITGYVNGVAGSTPYNISTSTVEFTTGTGTLIGRNHISAGTARFFSGYIQDFRVYKGVAKYTSNFNPPSSTQNATIAAGNDSLVDTPTSYGTDTGAGGEVRGNYCTWNPLDKASVVTLSNGNLDAVSTSFGENRVRGTIQIPDTDSWYFEITVGSPAAGYIGIASASAPLTSGSGAKTYGYNEGGNFYTDGSVAGGGAFATFTTNDVIGVKVTSNSTITFYKNGTQTGTSKSIDTSYRYFPLLNLYNMAVVANFGQRPWAYPANATGAKALCDTNLPTPVVAKPNEVMDVKLYTGNGSTQTISGLGFSPDLVWIKSRSDGTDWNMLADTVRGAGQALYSNTTNAEGGPNYFLSAFTGDGFSVNINPNDGVNTTNDAYVAWTWDAGSSTVTNTDGSITSQVRANASAGFSIVTWSGTSSNGTIGHGLGVAPCLVIGKCRNASSTTWLSYHVSLGGTKYIELNNTNAAATASNVWNNTDPTSSVVNIGTSSGINQSGRTYVAYCFAPVAGYSAFGSYTGNGSADGPFVYTGFRPRYLLIKASSASGEWGIYDSMRDPYNVVSNVLLAENSGADNTGLTLLDFTSNGFKLRNTNLNRNTNGTTYVYAAFAENPFQYARAR